MIFYATAGQTAAQPAQTVMVEHAAAAQVYRATGPGTPPVESSLKGEAGEQATIQPPAQEVLEDFDWNNRKVVREYVRLEQKVLAKRATLEETRRYQSMRRDRNSQVFAERYLQDYAEVQRLKKLSEKLAEIQQYLRPIQLR